jgi:hypothetical protein
MDLRKYDLSAVCIGLSIAAHLFILSLIDNIRPFQWTRPIVVTLVEPAGMRGKTAAREQPAAVFRKAGTADSPLSIHNEVKKGSNGEGQEDAQERADSSPDLFRTAAKQKTVELPESDEAQHEREEIAAGREIEEGDCDSPPASRTQDTSIQTRAAGIPQIVISAKREKLTYRINMFGLSVGNAVLEVVIEGNEFRISSTVSSNAIISSFYPVSDYAESRHIAGRYIISRVRQREGNFTSDTGFTIALPEKNIFWIDLKQNSFANHPLPREDVLDVLSGLYYLRHQRLEVGKTVVLHLFDSNRYAETTVEVLRREHVSLPGFREVDALVIHPLIKTDCIFRRAGDMLIWLSDDENRVPVILETSVHLGRVRAELVSAEGDWD